MPVVDTEDVGGLDTPLSGPYLFEQAGLWGPEPIIDRYGNAFVGVDVFIYYSDGETLAALYEDRTKTQQVDNPAQTNEVGNLSFYADPGSYVVKIVSSGLLLGQFPTVVQPHPEELAEMDDGLLFPDGIILGSPDLTQWRVTVANDGTLSTTEV